MAENDAQFTVRGVDSEDDAREIEDELHDLEGVMGADVDPESGEATVKVDADVLSGERVKITVREMGYEVE